MNPGEAVKMDSEYKSFLAELGGGPPATDTVAPRGLLGFMLYFKLKPCYCVFAVVCSPVHAHSSLATPSTQEPSILIYVCLQVPMAATDLETTFRTTASCTLATCRRQGQDISLHVLQKKL